MAFAAGLACAVVSAFGTNLSFLYKHRGAVAAPDVDIRKPLRSAIDLFRSKWWTIGWAVGRYILNVGGDAPAVTEGVLDLRRAVAVDWFSIGRTEVAPAARPASRTASTSSTYT